MACGGGSKNIEAGTVAKKKKKKGKKEGGEEAAVVEIEIISHQES